MALVSMGKAIRSADGILVNTWQDLEPTTLAALRDPETLGRLVNAPIYPIGPLVRPIETPTPSARRRRRNKVLQWLDMQHPESVIYVSFGSGGTLSAKQIIELAWGLELSQQRFVWVVRPPPMEEGNASASYLLIDRNGRDDTPYYLPEGFMSRTQELGLVVQNWAPQAEILVHPSVGGFLSHCGWNSTLESLINGVPIMGWPLFAEQKMNATLLTEELGNAVRVRGATTGGVVGREEIQKMVRKIMVDERGKRIRERAKELKHSGEKALLEGGSSYNSLCQLARDCEIHLQGLVAHARGA